MKKLIELYIILFRFWMRWPEKLRYLLVGGYNTVISYALYALFLYWWNKPQFALFLSFFVSSVNSYWTQKIYVFGTHGKYLSEYLRCLFSWGISYLMNVALLQFFLWIKLNPYVAQFIALILITVNSYILLKYLAFQNHKQRES